MNRPSPHRPAHTSSQPIRRLVAGLAVGVRGAAAAAALGAVIAPLAAIAPEPDPVPRRWQLNVEVGPLQVTTIDVKGVGPRSYLYLPYHVVNNSGQDVLFAPMWEYSNGAGTIVRSGRDVPQEVTSQILASLKDPFAQDQIEIIGELLQGEENSKDGVAIWPLNDTAPERMTIYAAGFSGETKTVVSPDGKERFVLRKTLMLDFSDPGSLIGQSSQAIPLRGKQWIMR